VRKAQIKPGKTYLNMFGFRCSVVEIKTDPAGDVYVKYHSDNSFSPTGIADIKSFARSMVSEVEG
jgi:hypothetical protein